MLDLYLAEGVTPIEGERFATDQEEQGIEVVRLPYEEALRRAAGPAGTPGPGRARPLRAQAGREVDARPGGPAPPDAPARRAARRPD